MNGYYERNIDRNLSKWAAQNGAKPLVLRGARQVGKSTTVRKLGERFDLFLELNLDRQADRELVRACKSAADLLAAVLARRNLPSVPARTLLFIDEIQESADAIAWLREFKEDFTDLHVVAAGSLLEIRLEERGFSFPVGRVTFRTLHPFSYLEFLRATERNVLAERIESAVFEIGGLPSVLHSQALIALRDYLLVGGMPEAVAQFERGGSLGEVQGVHADLLQGFAEDIQKYRHVRNTEYLKASFANLPKHYGQRFHYENFAPGYRLREMKTALGRFESAMFITRVWPTSALELPLAIRPRSAPKLLALDVALAPHSMNVQIATVPAVELETILDGRTAEMFVGQQLLSAQQGPREPMYFWVRESARANSEIDYLIPAAGVPMPVEVKSGSGGTLRSMHQFLKRAKLATGIRLSTNEILDERVEVKMDGERLSFRLISLPLYAAELVPKLASSGI